MFNWPKRTSVDERDPNIPSSPPSQRCAPPVLFAYWIPIHFRIHIYWCTWLSVTFRSIPATPTTTNHHPPKVGAYHYRQVGRMLVQPGAAALTLSRIIALGSTYSCAMILESPHSNHLVDRQEGHRHSVKFNRPIPPIETRSAEVCAPSGCTRNIDTSLWPTVVCKPLSQTCGPPFHACIDSLCSPQSLHLLRGLAV